MVAVVTCEAGQDYAVQMDEPRPFSLPPALPLAKRQMRLIDESYDRRRTGSNTYAVSDPHWRVEGLEPASPWLDVCVRRIGITSVISAIALVRAACWARSRRRGRSTGAKRVWCPTTSASTAATGARPSSA